MPFLEYLEPRALSGGTDVNMDSPPNAVFQLSMAISLKRIADMMAQQHMRSRRAVRGAESLSLTGHSAPEPAAAPWMAEQDESEQP